MMSVLQEAVQIVTSPLVAACLLAVTALILRFCGRLRIARALLLCAVGIAYLACIPFTGRLLLAPLEGRFPPLAPPVPPVRYIVVLGSGYAPRDGIPITAALDADGLARVAEGVRLWRGVPGARLVVSGGASHGHGQPAARGYAEFARSLGVAPEAIIVSDQATDTAAEARAIKALLGTAPFLLVTSASHMPRAVLLMRRAGAVPIPAPTGQRASLGTDMPLWRAALPGSAGLRDTELAVHEYLGLAAIKTGLE